MNRYMPMIPGPAGRQCRARHSSGTECLRLPAHLGVHAAFDVDGQPIIRWRGGRPAIRESE